MTYTILVICGNFVNILLLRVPQLIFYDRSQCYVIVVAGSLFWFVCYCCCFVLLLLFFCCFFVVVMVDVECLFWF